MDVLDRFLRASNSMSTMDLRQKLRQAIAENAIELTPDQLEELIDSLCPSFNLYEKFMVMSGEDIRKLAEECGDTYEAAKDHIEFALCIGYLKWG